MVYKIKEKPKLKIETALVNASSYIDFLSIDSLVRSHLLPEAEEMSSILDQMKKCSHTDYAPNSSFALPMKLSISKGASHIQALPPPPVETEGLVEKSSTQELAVSTPLKSRSRSLQQSNEVDFLSPYQRDNVKHIKSEFLTDLNDRSLPKLYNAIQWSAF